MSESKPVNEQNAETEDLSAEELSSVSGGIKFFSSLKKDFQKAANVVGTVAQVADTVSKVAKVIPK
jgi:hypothetical protein